LRRDDDTVRSLTPQQLADVDDDRYRPVVNEFDLHLGAEHAVSTGTPSSRSRSTLRQVEAGTLAGIGVASQDRIGR
jgi:hypothetical protein